MSGDVPRLLFYKPFDRAVFKMEVPVKDLKDMSRQEIKQTYEAFQFDFDEKRGICKDSEDARGNNL